MLKKIKLLLIAFSTVAINCSIGQDGAELKLLSHPEDFNIQERVLLVLDQDFYLAGERINFFALGLDAALQVPVGLSSILYIELFDQDNNVVNSKKVLLQNGHGAHFIAIPRQLRTGYYYLRAYTNYMKNCGAGAFYTKRVQVVNPFLKIPYMGDEGVQRSDMKLNIAPEGGRIIFGVENKVLFYLTDVNNRIFARLLENGTVVDEIDSKKGFGSFVFTPQPGNEYKIEAVSASREKMEIGLHHIAPSGVICRLDSVVNNKAYIRVIAKDFNKNPLNLFVNNNGIVYGYTHQLKGSEISLEINLPAGLNEIIIKDNDDITVANRLVYIKPQAGLEINARLNKAAASPGDSVVVQIESAAHDTIHYIVALNLGSSATLPSIQEAMESNIYLNSLASCINNITLNELTDIGNNLLYNNDYLLKYQQTDKATRKTAGEGTITYLPEIEHDLVSGTVLTRVVQAPVSNALLYLSFIDSICHVYKSTTDSLGHFVFALPFDYQGNELVIAVKDTVNDYNIRMENEFYPKFLPVNKEFYYPDSSLKKIIEQRMPNLQVNDAFSDMPGPSKPQRPALRFYGYPDSEYKVGKYVNLPTLDDFIFEIVREATIVRSRNTTDIRVISSLNNTLLGDSPLFILDGVPLLRTGKLAAIPAEHLESVRIVNNTFFFGTEIFDGIVDITSKKKSFNLLPLDRNSITASFSPVYTRLNNGATKGHQAPLYKSVLYFGAMASFTGNENLKLQLPQNKGDYSLTVFGYTKQGKWGSMALPEALKLDF